MRHYGVHPSVCPLRWKDDVANAQRSVLCGQQRYGWPKRSRGSGVAWGHGCVRYRATQAVWLLASSVRHPSPGIRICVAVWAEAVRSAACAAVSSLRKLSSGGYRRHKCASFQVRLGAYHLPLGESACEALPRMGWCAGWKRTQMGGR